MHAALHGIAGLFTWPRRLRQQVLLVVLLIMVAAMVLLYRVSTHRLAEVALQSSSEWAAAVARSAASAGTEPLALQDVAGLQVVLQDIASLPGVLGIDTFDAQGHPMLALRLAPDGKRVTSHWRLPDLKPPPASAAAAHVQHVDGQRRLYAWAPIGPEGSLGLVGVTFSLEREQAHVDALRYDAVMAIGFAGLLTGVGVWLLLRRALTPLQRVVDFSRRLADQPGLQFNALGSSLEVAELTAVLNEASRRLRAQLDTIRASEDQMAAILHTVPDAIIGFGDDGLIASASPAAEELFDRPLAELVGRPLQELLPGLDADDADRRTLTGRYRALSASHVARHEILRRLGEGRAQAWRSRSRAPSRTAACATWPWCAT